MTKLPRVWFAVYRHKGRHFTLNIARGKVGKRVKPHIAFTTHLIFWSPSCSFFFHNKIFSISNTIFDLIFVPLITNRTCYSRDANINKSFNNQLIELWKKKGIKSIGACLRSLSFKPFAMTTVKK